jgi:hypothetical protein
MIFLFEFFAEILAVFVGRVIISFFGYYSLLIVYKIIGNKADYEWIKATKENNEMDAFNKSCLITISGFISFGFFLFMLYQLILFLSEI